MEYRIQNLVLPTQEKHKACRKLFYRGAAGVVANDGQSLLIGLAQTCDFVSYLNACSWQKWKKYTNAKDLTLHLKFKGKAKLSFLGYHKDNLNVARTTFDCQTVTHQETQEFVYHFPENDEQMVGFEIAALSSKLEFMGGYFAVKVRRNELRDIKLALAMTTFRKEEYAYENIALLRENLLKSDDKIAQDLFLHIVDNGETLKIDDTAKGHITLHANKNVGGAGGFARGMIEALHQDPQATHVLLMDDDVLVLPESIFRTYKLLSILKPQFYDYVISGAMLYYENPTYQHEDIGLIRNNSADPDTLKDTLNHELLFDNLKNEAEYALPARAYAAWWFCCVPIEIIKENGLPLPIFVRRDDIEFGIRNRIKVITLNGVCVWHQGFVTKHNLMMTYFDLRNNLITAMTSNAFDLDAAINALYTKIRSYLMSFRYNAAEICIDALEDFLKGPGVIRKPVDPKFLGYLAKMNETLQPLAEINEEVAVIDQTTALWDNPTLSLKTRVFLKLTWNGQRGPKLFKERQDISSIAFDWVLQPERVAYRRRILAIDPFSLQGVLYEKDSQRFTELYQRYKAATKYYKKNRDKLLSEYQDARKEFVSEEFWKQYLNLE